MIRKRYLKALQSKFCTKNNLRNIILKTKEKIDIDEDKILDKNINMLNKVMIFDEKIQKVHKEFKQELINATINSKTPLKSVMSVFQIYNKYGYDQDMLADTVEFLGNTQRTYRNQSRVYQDFTHHGLMESQRFYNIIQEVKYGLQNQIPLEFENLEKITRGIYNIQYKNIELQDRIYEKLQQLLFDKKIENKDKPQFYKKHYYEQEIGVELKDEIAQVVFSLRDKKEKDEIEKWMDEFKQNQQSLELKIKSILSIREYYFKIYQQSQKLKNLKDDHTMNLQLLELEESLINAELISIEDLRDPTNNFTNNNIDRTVQVVQNYLEINFPNFNEFQHYNVLAQKVTEMMEQDYQDQINEIKNTKVIEKSLDYVIIAKIVNNLAMLSNSEISEINKNDYIVNNQIFKNQVPDIAHEFNNSKKIMEFDRYYSQIFQDGLNKIQEIYDQIDKQNIQGLNALYFSSAFAVLGQSQKSQDLLKIFLDQYDLQQIEYQDFKTLLNVIFKVEQFKIDSDKLKQLQEYVNKNFDNFSLETKLDTLLIKELEVPSLDLFFTQLSQNQDDFLQNSDVEFLEKLSLIRLKINLPFSVQLSLDQLKIQKQKNQDPYIQQLQLILAEYQESEQFQQIQLEQILYQQPDYISKSKNQCKLVYLLQSSETCIDTQKPNYFTQIKHQLFQKTVSKLDYQFQFEFVPIQKFYQLKENQIQFHNQEQILQILQEATKIEQQNEKISNLAEIVLELQKQDLNDHDKFIINNIIKRISNFAEYDNNYAAIQFKKIQLKEIYEQYKFLNQRLQQQIDDAVKLPLFQFLQEIKEQLNQIKVEKYNESWIGKRLSSDLISKNQQFNENQLMNQDFINDKDYFQYSNNHLLLKDITYNNLSFLKLEKMTSKLIANQDYAQILPYEQNINQIYPSSIESENKLIGEQEQNMIDNEINCVVQVQNFKFELKQNPQKVLDILMNFEFIENLLEKQKNLYFANSYSYPRKIEEFFQYQEKLSKKLPESLLDRELTEKGQQNKKLQDLLDIKNNKIKSLFQKVQKGEYDEKRYEEFRKSVDQQIQEEIKKIDQDNKEQNIFGHDVKQILEIQYEKPEQKGWRDSLNQDKVYFINKKDLQESQGVFSIAFLKKKFKAQQKLVKCQIILKLNRNIDLSDNEKEFVKHWKANTIESFMKPTNLTIGSLSKKDLQIFKNMEISQLQLQKNFNLDDFILEFGLFFDDKFVQQLDNKIQKDEWDTDIFDLQVDKSYKLRDIEDEIFKQTTKLSNYEIENLQKLLQINRQTPFEKQQQQYYNETTFPNIDLMNQQTYRYELLETYIKKREVDTNKDPQIEQYIQKKTQEEMKELWQSQFYKSYEETNLEDIKTYIHNLFQRVYMLSKHFPQMLVSFLVILIQHPQISQFDKQKLAAFLDMYNIDLNLSSYDMEKLINFNQQQITLEQLKKDFENFSSNTDKIVNQLNEI